MKKMLLSLIILLSFTACQDKEKDAAIQAAHDAKIVAQARADLLLELKIAKEKQLATQSNIEQSQLNQMGVSIQDDTFSIDTKKANDYFTAMSKNMEAQMQKISDDLQKGMIDTKEAGIQISKEHINIDLNQTHKLLNDWSQKIELFAQEFDKLTTNPDINTTTTY